MTVEIDTDLVSSAVDHGRGRLDDARSAAAAAINSATDPRVKAALDTLLGRTMADLDKTGDTADKGDKAAKDFADHDRRTAASADAVPAHPTVAAPSAVRPMLSAAQLTGQSAQGAQIPAMTGSPAMMPMAPSPSMASQFMAPLGMAASALAPTMVSAVASSPQGQLPPGSVTMSRSQLTALIESGDLNSSGDDVDGVRASTWDGDTKPAPINVDDVAFVKGKGQLSDAEISAAIEGAMDKTGIAPEARPQFKAVLEFMAEKESSNNSDAVNLTDSNAVGPTQVDGAPSQSSRGPWQTIPSTFAAHHAPGTSNNIYDAEASAGAALNWMMHRYNVGPDGSGLAEFSASRRANGYTGY